MKFDHAFYTLIERNNIQVKDCSSSRPSVGLRNVKGRLWDWIYKIFTGWAEDKIEDILAGLKACFFISKYI